VDHEHERREREEHEAHAFADVRYEDGGAKIIEH
jgi:hypothetical protein